jgi:hypothetical protein
LEILGATTDRASVGRATPGKEALGFEPAIAALEIVDEATDGLRRSTEEAGAAGVEIALLLAATCTTGLGIGEEEVEVEAIERPAPGRSAPEREGALLIVDICAGQ